MIFTTGVYYDGKSSIPQSVSVEFNDGSGIVCLTFTPNNTYHLPIQELTIEKQGEILYLKVDQDGLGLIKISDSEFMERIQKFMKDHNQYTWYQKLLHLGIKIHILIAIGILGIITLVYLFIIPWVGEKSVMIIPQKFDQEIGNQAFEQYMSLNTIDSSKTKIANEFISHLHLENEIPIKITVVQSSQINAFALPDGNIVIYSEIIDQMKNYEELVGLITHEVAHINERHSMKMLCRNVSGYIFISAIFSDVNGIMAVISDNANNLQALSYSRRFEKEADFTGFKLMISNGVDPDGMIWLFKRLKGHDQMIPEFISTHPFTEKRISEIEKLKTEYSYKRTNNPELASLFVQL